MLLATAVVHAEPLKYPNLKNVRSLVRFDLPDGWKASQSADEVNTLGCESGDGSGQTVTFMIAPAADVAKDFTALAQSVMQLRNVGRSARLIASGSDTVGDGLAVAFARFANKVKGDPLLLTLYRLPTRSDKAVLVCTVEFMNRPADHQNISRKLLTSIRLVQN